MVATTVGAGSRTACSKCAALASGRDDRGATARNAQLQTGPRAASKPTASDEAVGLTRGFRRQVPSRKGKGKRPPPKCWLSSKVGQGRRADFVGEGRRPVQRRRRQQKQSGGAARRALQQRHSGEHALNAEARRVWRPRLGHLLAAPASPPRPPPAAPPAVQSRRTARRPAARREIVEIGNLGVLRPRHGFCA